MPKEFSTSRRDQQNIGSANNSKSDSRQMGGSTKQKVDGGSANNTSKKKYILFESQIVDAERSLSSLAFLSSSESESDTGELKAQEKYKRLKKNKNLNEARLVNELVKQKQSLAYTRLPVLSQEITNAQKSFYTVILMKYGDNPKARDEEAEKTKIHSGRMLTQKYKSEIEINKEMIQNIALRIEERRQSAKERLDPFLDTKAASDIDQAWEQAKNGVKTVEQTLEYGELMNTSAQKWWNAAFDVLKRSNPSPDAENSLMIDSLETPLQTESEEYETHKQKMKGKFSLKKLFKKNKIQMPEKVLPEETVIQGTDDQPLKPLLRLAENDFGQDEIVLQKQLGDLEEDRGQEVKQLLRKEEQEYTDRLALHREMGSTITKEMKQQEIFDIHQKYVEKRLKVEREFDDRKNNLEQILKSRSGAEYLLTKAHDAELMDKTKNSKAFNALLESKRYEDAVAFCMQVAQFHPDNAVIYSCMGDAFLAQNKYEEAEEAYGKAIERDHESAMYQNNMGDALYGQGKYKEAEPFYLAAIERDPKCAMYQGNMGHVLYAQGKHKEAGSYFLAAIERAPGHAAYYNYMGLTLRAQGEDKKAESLYLAAIERDPGHATYYNNMGVLLYAQGKYKEAESYFRQAIERDPKCASYQNSIGMTLYKQKKYKKAKRFYLAAIERDPEKAVYQNNMGNALFYIKRYKDAEQFFRQALEKDTNNALYQNDMGITLYKQKKYKESEPFYLAAIERDREDATYQRNMGDTLYRQEKYEEAEQFYLAAIERNPKKALYYGAMGETLYQQKKYEKAESFFRQVIEQDGENEIYHNYLELALCWQGKFSESIAAREARSQSK